MLYFCVNNNYDVMLDKKLIENIDEETCLIQVPFYLDTNDIDGFSTVIKFNNSDMLSFSRFLFHFKKILSVKEEIIEKLKITSNDILFIHTDTVLINNIIIEHFYSNKCKIYLLEDGVATMTDYNISSLKLNFIDRLRIFLFSKMYNTPNLGMVNIGVEKQLRINDNLFNGLIVTFGDKTLRKIPVYKVKLNYEKVNIEYHKGAIFLNQNFYPYYFNEEEFIDFLKEILIISARYQPFYFKFHQNDSVTMRNKIIFMIKKEYPDVSIIEENIPAEKIIKTYPVKYSITFFSTASINHLRYGLIPIFLVDLILQKKYFTELNIFKMFLDNINCKYPKMIEEINSNYNSLSCFEVDAKAISFKTIFDEIINKG